MCTEGGRGDSDLTKDHGLWGLQIIQTENEWSLRLKNFWEFKEVRGRQAGQLRHLRGWVHSPLRGRIVEEIWRMGECKASTENSLSSVQGMRNQTRQKAMEVDVKRSSCGRRKRRKRVAMMCLVVRFALKREGQGLWLLCRDEGLDCLCVQVRVLTQIKDICAEWTQTEKLS